MRAASTGLAIVSCATAASLVASFVPSTHGPRRRFPLNAAADASHNAAAESTTADATMSRRSALRTVPLGGMAAILPFLSTSTVASADDSSGGGADLTSQLFNPDGSLRDASSIEVEAKSRTVSTTFPSGTGDSKPGKQALVSVDGSKPATAATDGGNVRVSYDLPEKWGDPSTGYLDKSEGVNARSADAITVFQLAGPAEVKTLDRASTVGVAKALGIETLPAYNPNIVKADLISGRRSTRDGIVYYEFDMAVAPPRCSSGSKEDLGLGFCPYDSIVLLGAAVVDGRMYGIMVECDRDEWKKGNADLKRVRSSFRVESELEMLQK